MGKATRAKILVVDDNPSKLAALEAVLAPLSLEVVPVRSGREALRVLLRQDFALILLDVRMTEMDGFETAALIRQRRVSEHTPIIFLTAFEQAELDMARGYSLGAVDFIFSPIVPEVLRAKAAVFVELYQKTEEIRDLFAAAQESSRSKSEFLNMAAHELRTPLSVVSGYLAMLAEGSLGPAPDAWRMPLEMMTGKTGELNRIVDDLLMASRMDVGWLPEQMHVVDLREVLDSARRRAEPRAQLLHADLRTECEDNPVLVEADPLHLGRILDNLINNALTYCSAKPVVTLALAGGEMATLEVRDNGIGIPEEKQEAVFERFVRLDDSTVGPVPGTGLGLYISRELARRHGGQLELRQSRPGDGSVFRLLLPLAAAEDGTGGGSGNGRPRLHIHQGGR
ncbi:MAG TPA: hybrid sensor histidine kinase/response regulator [Candidatus Dormibacteraeota bacterium]|nr:hybrid sensor histidine kinase/response regulator [Candidatus Dormibacteraeota bacterium]